MELFSIRIQRTFQLVSTAMGKCTAIWIHRELTGQKKSLRTQKKKLTVRIIWLNCQLFDYKPEKPFYFDPATIYNYNLLY